MDWGSVGHPNERVYHQGDLAGRPVHRIICYGATFVITAAVLFSCRDLQDLDTWYLNDLDPAQNNR